eukprot:TRINITY_DN88498_c1_g1_i1.p2 TRINITY_DN88498_c1_g1~~TRINITY_DN88498_c1_g1_i1.p2  ORF type:complete len:325 (+),score=14.41 TRINITY_DN88498_c1_g1_i1:90-977(+)
MQQNQADVANPIQTSLKNDLPTPLYSIIKEEIAAATPAISQILRSELQNSHRSAANSGWEILGKHVCTNCGEKLLGDVYICAECIENKICLCRHCEAAGVHSYHAFLKVRNQDQLRSVLKNLRIDRSIYVEEEAKKPNSSPFLKRFRTKMAAAAHRVGKWIKTALRKYPKEMAIVLGGKEQHLVSEPGNILIPYWRFKNASAIAWPSTVYVRISLQEERDEYVRLANVNVEPNAEVSIGVPMTAPTKEGRYIAKARFMDEYGDIIGGTLRIILIVESKKVPSKQFVSLLLRRALR